MAEEKKNGTWQGLLFIALVLIVAGFVIVHKNKKFSGEHEFYTYYANIKGLQSSSPVQLKGVRVGKISDIDLNGGGRVKVSLRIKKGVELPEGTVALLASENILGDKVIRLLPGKGPANLPDLSVLPSSYDTSVMKASIQIAPYLETAKLLLKSTDTSLKGFNMLFQTQMLSSIVSAFVSAEKTFDRFSKKTAKWNEHAISAGAKIEHIDSSTEKMTSGLQNLSTSLNKLQTKTGHIADKPLKKDMQDLQVSINKLKASFTNFNKKDSGFSKFINNKQAYTNMSSNFDTLNKSLKKTYTHPSGFSIFGKNK
jgi:phospholipid/cholesterol/gamma-HCH transport system substrate-binding protein